MRHHTLHRHLRAALGACELPTTLTWYQCTRHTFASQWVLAGGSIEKLAEVMGHSSTEVTRRYARLRPDLLQEADYELLDVDLSRGPGEVVRMPEPGAPGQRIGNGTETGAAASAGSP